MSDYTDDLEYTIAKRIPNMEHGFHIETDYGYFAIDSDEADLIIKAVLRTIEKKLKIAEAKKIALVMP